LANDGGIESPADVPVEDALKWVTSVAGLLEPFRWDAEPSIAELEREAQRLEGLDGDPNIPL
jgi:hypothetical protein